MENDTTTNDEVICRYCRGPETPDDPMLQPCGCTGSIAFIHLSCLNQWITDRRGSFQCELCQQPYKIINEIRDLAKCFACLTAEEREQFLVNLFKPFYRWQLLVAIQQEQQQRLQQLNAFRRWKALDASRRLPNNHYQSDDKDSKSLLPGESGFDWSKWHIELGSGHQLREVKKKLSEFVDSMLSGVSLMKKSLIQVAPDLKEQSLGNMLNDFTEFLTRQSNYARVTVLLLIWCLGTFGDQLPGFRSHNRDRLAEIRRCLQTLEGMLQAHQSELIDSLYITIQRTRTQQLKRIKRFVGDVDAAVMEMSELIPHVVVPA